MLQHSLAIHLMASSPNNLRIHTQAQQYLNLVHNLAHILLPSREVPVHTLPATPHIPHSHHIHLNHRIHPSHPILLNHLIPLNHLTPLSHLTQLNHPTQLNHLTHLNLRIHHNHPIQHNRLTQLNQILIPHSHHTHLKATLAMVTAPNRVPQRLSLR